MSRRGMVGVVLAFALAAVAAARLGQVPRAEASANAASPRAIEGGPRFEQVRDELERRANETKVLAEATPES